MDVSVIIVNYNTLELTKNTIDSVIEKTKNLNYEIILVDNSSTDGSVEFFEREYKDKIIFIKNNENLGFGRANNKGIEIAKGKYVFLLNSDTLLINNAIKILFDFMEKNENCGVCGGNLFDINLRPTNSFNMKMLSYKDEYINSIVNLFLKIFKLKKKSFNYTQIPLKVEIIIGADMFIRKNIFSKIGKFDEDFFMYHEESELCFRILKNGYKIYSIPQAEIIHLEGRSSQFKEKKFRMDRFHKYMFFYKTRGKKSLKWVYLLSQTKFLNLFDIKRFRINSEEYLRFKLFLESRGIL